MKNVYIMIGLGVSLFVSVAVAFIFFDFWQQEKDKAISLSKDNERLERQIKAIESNTDENLLSIGEAYTEKQFTYSEGDHDRGVKVMGDYYSEAYKSKLKKLKGKHTDEKEAAVGRSKVKIIDSAYNKKAADKAKVTVTFEQITQLDGLKTKVLYDIVLDMVYIKDSWKINDMQLIEKI